MSSTPLPPNIAVLPAHQSRGMRAQSRQLDDSYDSSSMSFSRPPSSKKGNSSMLGLGHTGTTSVNIATAIYAAQNKEYLTPSVQDRSLLNAGKPHRSSLSPQPPSLPRSFRGPSPAEQMSSSAQALRPVRFYLRPTDEEEEDMINNEHSYNSNSTRSSAPNDSNTSTDISYSYQQEEAYVKQARGVPAFFNETTAALSVPKRTSRRPRISNEDMPYRPVEEHFDSDDSGEGGEGVVRGGALDGRADTRGRRKEQGEGYLGMGLGINNSKRKSLRSHRKTHDINYTEYDSGQDFDEPEDTYYVSPKITREGTAGLRSTTPLVVQSPVTRAKSPSTEDPIDLRRRREPTQLRSTMTNLFHVPAKLLLAIVNIFTFLLQRIGEAYRDGRSALRRAKRNGYNLGLIFAVVALLVGLRLATLHWGSIYSPGNEQYQAPTAIPSSMDELVSRLTSLEQAVTGLTASSQAIQEAAEQGRRATSQLVNRISHIESAHVDHSKEAKAMRDTITQLRSEYTDVLARVRSHEGSIHNFAAVERDVQALRKRITAAEHDVRVVLDEGRMRAALEQILPNVMPVRTDSRGSLKIDPSFWGELKKIFASHDEVASAVRAVPTAGREKVPQPPAPSAAEWRFEDHERRLEEWASNLFTRKAQTASLVSRSEFITLMEDELSALRTELDLVRHVAQSASSAAAASPKVTGGVTIRTPKGEDITNALQGLIDAALLKFSKDTIAQTDYALFTAGARVIPSLTTDTLVVKQPSTLGRWIRGDRAIEGRQPATALLPDNHPGNCWPFKGEQGQIGIRLARKVAVTAVTIEHAAKELALDLSTAPRNIEVWAMIEGEENRRKGAYLASTWDGESSQQPSDGHVLLASFVYEPWSLNPVQTFSIAPHIRELGIETGVIVFKIQSNYGGDLTCLYRVRVHGEVISTTTESEVQSEDPAQA